MPQKKEKCFFITCNIKFVDVASLTSQAPELEAKLFWLIFDVNSNSALSLNNIILN